MSKWVSTRLGELVTFHKGRKVDTSPFPKAGYDAYLGAGALSGKDDGYGSSHLSVQANQNDVLMLWDGERSGLVQRGLSGVVSSTVCKLSPTGAIGSDLLYYLLSLNFDWIQNRRTGTGVPHVPKDIGRILQITYPSDQDEQRKIAHILKTIDRAIGQTEALIDKYQQIKAGLMHDLFTRGIGPDGQLRPPREQAPHLYEKTPIGWIPREWEFGICEDVCEKIIDCKNRTPPVTPDGHPVIRTPNVRNGRFVDDGIVFTDKRSYSIWTARGAPQPGDVVITREAPVGEVCKIPERHKYACLGQRMMLYRVDPEKIIEDFFLYVLQSNAVRNRLDLISGGSTVGHVRVGDIRTLWIFYPKDKEEQSRISEALKAASSNLEAEENNREKLHYIKSGLMHDLLTGKVTVTVKP